MKLHQEVAGLLETSQAPLARNTWIILGVTPSIQKHLDFFTSTFIYKYLYYFRNSLYYSRNRDYFTSIKVFSG